MDATGTERAVLVSLSRGAERSLLLAADHPERVDRHGVHRARRCRCRRHRRERRRCRSSTSGATSYDGWGKWNRHYWLEHYEDFLEFFFSQCFTEPHSTKQIEDASAGGSRPTPRRWSRRSWRRGSRTRRACASSCPRIDCPMLVIHGSDDAVRPCAIGRAARRAGGRRARDPRGRPATARTPATR